MFVEDHKKLGWRLTHICQRNQNLVSFCSSSWLVSLEAEQFFTNFLSSAELSFGDLFCDFGWFVGTPPLAG